MTPPRTSVTIGALGLTMLMSACDLNHWSSAHQSPTTPSASDQLAPITETINLAGGEITIRSMTPASPATIPARECHPYAPAHNEVCTVGLQMAFEAQLSIRISRAIVTADFYAGSKLCGHGESDFQRLAAGEPATFSVSRLSLQEEGGPLLCPLPTVTTRMVVRLWEAGSSSELLTQEFAHTYTFAEP
jgi:hypothetical protein